MRILTVLTYYRPHTSGLTIYAERLAEALAKRGHDLTVLTSQYMPSLLKEESQNGVRIVRAPVVMRISKGVISPQFGRLATHLVRAHDVIQLHLPQFDAPGVVLRGRLMKKPTVLTYHCDLQLPTGLFNNLVNRVVHLANHTAAKLTDKIVTYTQDYADHSPYLSRYREKLEIILPPVVLPNIPPERIGIFAHEHGVDKNRPVIGMAARLAAEKGVEILLNALPKVLEAFPHTKVLFAGQFNDVLGEQDYYNRLMPAIRQYEQQGRWEFVGVLTPEEMAAFYPNLDVLVVPSLNSTEAFGLVQIEAMINGVPCVASSLPGVRQPIRMHSMGEVVPIGNVEALAEAMLKILTSPQKYQADSQAIAACYTPDAIAARYETMFASLLDKRTQL
jgi:glycosyltransferase involved in cell wall biosynthesis